MTKQTSKRYSPEVRERAVRMVLEHQGQANEILRKASAYFAVAELDRRSKP